VEILAHITIVLTAIYAATILLFIAGMMIRRRGQSMDKPRVSVIIAARNEENNIGDILSDLVNQSYSPDLYEVIIANDHSHDRTAEVVSRFSNDFANVTLLNIETTPPNFSPKKYAIQKAVNMSTGDIILATDADCRVGQKWIESMVSYFEPAIGFVIGFSQFGAKGEKQNFIERFQAFDFVTLMGAAVGTTNLGFPLAASGQNLAYRKSIFEEIGGYKKIAHRVSGDDVLLLQLVRKFTSTKIVFAGDPETFAVSAPQPTLKDFINQRKRWASNGSIQIKLNFGFFLYLLQVLLFNAALLLGLAAAMLSGQYIGVMLICFGTRILSEFLIALRAALYFDRTDLLKYFPLWFLAQIPYIVGVGLAGTFGKFKWKERQHSAEVKS
jgi:cellulose synthase/poly-beta-1,6-N-acetylglucosamine synthase-like glycosyltransferase